MTLPNNISAYQHIREVLDNVVAQRRTARYELPTAKAAIRFRYEAYKFRALARGEYASTPYDAFRLIIRKDDPCAVHFENAPIGKLEFTDEPLTIAHDSLLAVGLEEEKRGSLAHNLNRMWVSGTFKSELDLWNFFAPKHAVGALVEAFDECGLVVPEDVVPLV